MLKWQRSYTFRVFELLLSEAYRFKDNDYNCIFETNLAEFKFQIGCYDVDWPAPKEVLGKKNLTSEDYEAAELAILKDYEKNKDSYGCIVVRIMRGGFFGRRTSRIFSRDRFRRRNFPGIFRRETRRRYTARRGYSGVSRNFAQSADEESYSVAALR